MIFIMEKKLTGRKYSWRPRICQVKIWNTSRVKRMSEGLSYGVELDTSILVLFLV